VVKALAVGLGGRHAARAVVEGERLLATSEAATGTHVRADAWTPWGKVEVRDAALGSRAALLGASPLLEGA
jgi:hypothetical protein